MAATPFSIPPAWNTGWPSSDGPVGLTICHTATEPSLDLHVNNYQNSLEIRLARGVGETLGAGIVHAPEGSAARPELVEAIAPDAPLEGSGAIHIL